MQLQLLMLLLMLPCGDNNNESQPDPSELMMEVTIADNREGEITIVANANNTVEYHFLLGNGEQLIEKNETGEFQYTFAESGTYLVQVRAYGASGRYIKKEKQVEISIGNDEVPLEQGYSTPLAYDGYALVWNDEFNSDDINTDYWSFETGDGCPDLCGWGNNELQYYRKENAWTEEGVLVIEARNEAFSGKQYTSTRMKSQDKKSFRYGRIDIRALLPKGQGIWPALWMLGNNISTAGWPSCGEIDIMELIGGTGNDNTVHGTVHYDKDGSYVFHGGKKTISNEIYAEKYHVFSIIWDETSITWHMDDMQYYSVDITPQHMSEFHQEFFFILNIAVGGNWPGDPDSTTIFPQQMKIDYIRVFQPDA